GGAVVVQVRPGALGAHEERDRVSGCGHSRADQPVPLTLGPRLRTAPGPAETRGAPLEAFAQPGAGPGVAGIGVDIGDVAQSQLDRVDSELAGQLVHRALEREHAEGL